MRWWHRTRIYILNWCKSIIILLFDCPINWKSLIKIFLENLVIETYRRLQYFKSFWLILSFLDTQSWYFIGIWNHGCYVVESFKGVYFLLVSFGLVGIYFVNSCWVWYFLCWGAIWSIFGRKWQMLWRHSFNFSWLFSSVIAVDITAPLISADIWKFDSFQSLRQGYFYYIFIWLLFWGRNVGLLMILAYIFF